MRIGCLQFSPQSNRIDGVNNNMSRADSILTKPQAKGGRSLATESRLDILVLPQMAFTGSNFGSETEIRPFLEPAVAGETQLWARTAAIKYRCNVVVGYPEQVNIACAGSTSVEYFSSSIMVDFDGNTLANNNGRTRDGRDPAFSDCIAKRRGKVDDKVLGKVSIGQYTNPGNDKTPNFGVTDAFAYHILERDIDIAIIPLAWRTKRTRAEFSSKPLEPDVDALSHWAKSLWPLVEAKLEREIIIILGNQTGSDGDATYAGTSAVLGIKSGEMLLYGLLGGGLKELLVVDTSTAPIGRLRFVEEEGTKRSDGAESPQAEPLTPDASSEQLCPAQENFKKHAPDEEGLLQKQNDSVEEGVDPLDVPLEHAAAGQTRAIAKSPIPVSPSKRPQETLAAQYRARTGPISNTSTFTSTVRSPTASTPHPSRSHGNWRSHYASNRLTSRTLRSAAPRTPTRAFEDPATAISTSPQFWNGSETSSTPDSGSLYSTGVSSAADTTVSSFDGPLKRNYMGIDRPKSTKSRNVKVSAAVEVHGGQTDCVAVPILANPSILATNLQTGSASQERRGRRREKKELPEEEDRSSSRDSTRNGLLHRRVNRRDADKVRQVSGRRSQSAGSRRPRGFPKMTPMFMAQSVGFHSWPVSKAELQRASEEIHEPMLKRGR